MRTVRPGAKLRVELRGDEPGMVTQLDYLDQAVIRRGSAEDHARFPHRLAIRIVELETMPVPLVDDRLPVRLGRQRSGLQLAGIETEPHRAALVGDVALLGQEVDDRMAGEGIELRAVGVGLAQQIAAELDDRALHPETEPEIGG